MPSSRLASGLLIQWGYFVKNAVDVTIYFPDVFNGTPSVLITSEWPNAGVGYVETLKSVSTSGFTVHSGNRASNYWVNWMAIGYAAADAPLSQGMQDAVCAFDALTKGGDANKIEGDVAKYEK